MELVSSFGRAFALLYKDSKFDPRIPLT